MAEKLTITDRFIYNLIHSYSSNDKAFFASNEYIGKELGKSKSVISHSISRLIKLGYLENRGNKMARQLYTKKELLSADFNIKSAENSTESAENSISLEYIKREIAKNSNNKMLKTAIESAENSNILLSILISYTNIKEKDKKENVNYDNHMHFSTFLSFYPNKDKKTPAKDLFMKLSNKEVHDILDLVQSDRFQSHYKKTERQFIPNCFTWLNDKRWLDFEYAEDKKTGYSEEEKQRLIKQALES